MREGGKQDSHTSPAAVYCATGDPGAVAGPLSSLQVTSGLLFPQMLSTLPQMVRGHPVTMDARSFLTDFLLALGY